MKLTKLLHKGVIRQIPVLEVKFVSSIFVRPKRDGSYRLILNLRDLNHYVVTHHFKMETFKAALSLISKNCYFSSLDLKGAYFSICVNHSSQGWLDFCLKDTLHHYQMV